MKINEQKFNHWFNIFIIAGMLVSVCVINFFQLQEPDVEVLKQVIVAIGAIMGVLNTVLSANGNIWNFFFGVIEVSICAYANYDSNNMGLFYQHLLYFLPMQFVGLWQWKKRGAGKDDTGKNQKVQARKLNLKKWMIVLASFILGTLAVYGLLYWLDCSQYNAGKLVEVDRMKILLDASVVVLNIIGQILMSFAYAEQWYVWNMVNVFSIFLWINRLMSPAGGSYATVMLIKYVFYLLNSINGLRIWLKLAKDEDSRNRRLHCR